MQERRRQMLPMSQTCAAFLQEEWSEELRSSMQEISILNLFAVILGLLQTLWLSPYRPRKSETIERIARALDRWKQIWDFQNGRLTAQQLERYGLLKVAPLEFWQIASVLVKKGATLLDGAVDRSQVPNAHGDRAESCNPSADDLLENTFMESI